MFTVSDPMAISAYHAIMEAGLRIPSDISVVSVDNIMAATNLFPPLTTAGAGRHELARTAVCALLDEIQDKRNPGAKIFIPVNLTYRNFPPPADPPTEDNPGSRAREGVDSSGGHGLTPAAT